MNDGSYFDLFHDEVSKFRVLSLENKRRITLEKFGELYSFLEMISREYGISNVNLLNEVSSIIKDDKITDDDFVDVIYVYIESLKENFGTIFKNFMNKE